MNGFLASLVPAMANHVWQSTAFAAAAWVLTILLRKNSARVRYGLWLAASIKFLVPFSLLIVAGGLLPKPTRSVAPAVYTAMRATERPFADISSTSVTSLTKSTTLTQRIVADRPGILFALWLAGSIVVLIVWCARWRKASIYLREALPAEHGRELEILRRLESRVSGRRHSRMRLRLSSEQTEPSIYGIFLPVLVWPQQLSARLSDDIEAIMAHELAHARRHDNAAAAWHMLVEASFWFHPQVWWMERRMIEERERVCDEAVVRLQGKPEAYAEAILETCRFCVGSALPCVSGVTGADLRSRVVNIMRARMLARLTWPKKGLLGALALCALTAPVLLGQLNTSSDGKKAAGGKMSFEVASVKPNKSGDERAPSLILPGGNFTAANNTLRALILDAYGIFATPYLLRGGPAWIDSARYDVDAKAAAGAIPAGASNRVLWEDTRLMLQSLLADRFKLSVHTETKDMASYELVVAKNGPKLAKSSVDCNASALACHGFSEFNVFHFTGDGVDMYDLASMLSRDSDGPVVDHTGIQRSVRYQAAMESVPDGAAGLARPCSRPASRILAYPL